MGALLVLVLLEDETSLLGGHQRSLAGANTTSHFPTGESCRPCENAERMFLESSVHQALLLLLYADERTKMNNKEGRQIDAGCLWLRLFIRSKRRNRPRCSWMLCTGVGANNLQVVLSFENTEHARISTVDCV